MSYRYGRQAAWVLIAWSVVAMLLAAFNGPSWLNTPIVGTYTLLAVGLAVVLVARIKDIPTAIGLTVAVGLGSLLLASEAFLIAIRLMPLASLAVQAVAVCGLAVWSLLRPIPVGQPQLGSTIGDEGQA